MILHHPRPLTVLLTLGAALFLGACAADGDSAAGTVTETMTVTPGITTPTTTTATPATDTNSPTLVTTTTQVTPPTMPDRFGGCEPAFFLDEFTSPVVLFCDGAWARAGQAQTDHVLVFRYRDGRWLSHPHDGRDVFTQYPCYDEEKLRATGAPEELISQVSLCEPEDEQG
ncbi:hypothetical protein EAH68_13140 [Corynebacterium hylobatis]|uniref:Uncharacterized protein n=1 Tax=Corynebacterium hylobatis TaxID=1859290 RepID=A0A3R9ZC65_9CORY|nr:hypothetical protein [Corynebacterium hylobatis]RSZ61409.1 hypothetical protein EAH68_13140 [Corynebacterium hylobatis]